jgi:hypothetical protein
MTRSSPVPETSPDTSSGQDGLRRGLTDARESQGSRIEASGPRLRVDSPGNVVADAIDDEDGAGYGVELRDLDSTGDLPVSPSLAPPEGLYSKFIPPAKFLRDFPDSKRGRPS